MYILKGRKYARRRRRKLNMLQFHKEKQQNLLPQAKIFWPNWPISGSFGGKRGVFTQIFVVGRGLWPQGVGVRLAHRQRKKDRTCPMRRCRACVPKFHVSFSRARYQNSTVHAGHIWPDRAEPTFFPLIISLFLALCLKPNGFCRHQ